MKWKSQTFLAKHGEKDTIVPGTCKKKFKRGYIGFITRVSNIIIKLSEATLKDYAKISLDTDVWKNFKQQYLDQTNEREKKPLGDESK